MMNTMKLSLTLPLALLSALSFANAEDQAELQSLAKAAQNPIASMISLPFQNNANLNIGPNEQTQNILNIQPVWPFQINDDWNLITRTIVPVVSSPDALTVATEILLEFQLTFLFVASAGSIVALSWMVESTLR